MKYTVIITDSIFRNTEMEVEAKNENEAYDKAKKMWDDGELEDYLKNNDSDPYFEDIEIIDCE